MKIAVTGAGGYLGRGVVKSLLDHGEKVVAVGFGTEHVDPRAEVAQCDIFDIVNPYEAFGNPDILLHMAWRDGFSHYSQAHLDDLPRHYMLIEKLINAGLKKVCIMGSMHEVGFFEGPISENTPCWPSTPYGVSKSALRSLAEALCKRSSVDFQWLRGYYIVSSDSRGASIFAKIAATAKMGQEVFPFTMGQNLYDFIDYSDFCEAVTKTITQNSINGVINICSGHPQKLAERVERFIEENNFAIKLQYGAFPDRPYDSKAVWGDDTKLREIERLADGKQPKVVDALLHRTSELNG